MYWPRYILRYAILLEKLPATASAVCSSVDEALAFVFLVVGEHTEHASQAFCGVLLLTAWLKYTGH